jgi:D-glycero-D-manno-heptose 1,7-bisphosphate phosphatase
MAMSSAEHRSTNHDGDGNRATSTPQAWNGEALHEERSARAVFLDKDGTLVHDIPYNVDPSRITLLPGVGESLRRLQDAGFLLFVVSNQPGVALGRFPASALGGVEARLDELLTEFGVVISAYAWCTHSPAGTRGSGTIACTCRKPRPGLILDTAATHGVSLGESWMIGDILDDIEAGQRAGCRTILVDRGHETRWRAGKLRTPNAIVYQFADAATFVIDGMRGGRGHRPHAAPGR